MSFPIDFDKKEIYSSLDIGITIEAKLRCANQEAFCTAKVDTGSQVCLFEREIAEYLGIDVKSGYRETFSTLSGGIVGYAHQIELETLGLRFQSYVYFAESYAINRNCSGGKAGCNLSP